MKKLLTVSFLTLGIILISGCSLNEEKPVDNSAISPQITGLQKSGDTASQNKYNEQLVQKDNTCIQGAPKQEISSEPYKKYTLSEVELTSFKDIMGIESFCVPEQLGQLFLNVDWDVKQSNSGFVADSGRMISLGFKNLKNEELGGWGNGYIVYGTYDFSIGSEVDTYAIKSDYQSIKNGSKENIVDINGAKAFVQYRWDVKYDLGNMKKHIVFPFENYFVAIVYQFTGDYSSNHEQIISKLYSNEYPQEDKDTLQSIDDFTKSIKFKNKQ